MRTIVRTSRAFVRRGMIATGAVRGPSWWVDCGVQHSAADKRAKCRVSVPRHPGDMLGLPRLPIR